MAAPHVSGAIGLLKAHQNNLTYNDYKVLLRESVDRNNDYTKWRGRLNIYNALDILVKPYKPLIHECDTRMNNLKNYPSKWKCVKHKDYKDKCKWNVELNVCERNFTYSLTSVTSSPTKGKPSKGSKNSKKPKGSKVSKVSKGFKLTKLGNSFNGD